MNRYGFGIVLAISVLILHLGFLDSGRAADFPSNQELAERNVALSITGFNFTSGLKQDANGKPNGDGVELYQTSWGGSGFIVGEDGTIVTNYHVARKAMKGEALFQEGSRFEIRNLKIYDPLNDLAILKISTEKSFPACTLGDSNKVDLRDKVLAVGNPLGMGLNITEGAISQIIRNDLKETEGIRHTATMTSGNSGGALYRGNEVIGVNAAMATNPVVGGGTGFNYAIPINKAKKLLEEPKYNRLVPLTQVFPPSFAEIAKKAKQLDGVSGQIPAAKAQGAKFEPGVWKAGFQGLNLADYGFLVESPSNNITIVVMDSQDKLKGYANKKQNVGLPLLLSSDYAAQYTVLVLNFNNVPVNFGLKTYQIVW